MIIFIYIYIFLWTYFDDKHINYNGYTSFDSNLIHSDTQCTHFKVRHGIQNFYTIHHLEYVLVFWGTLPFFGACEKNSCSRLIFPLQMLAFLDERSDSTKKQYRINLPLNMLTLIYRKKSGLCLSSGFLAHPRLSKSCYKLNHNDSSVIRLRICSESKR